MVLWSRRVDGRQINRGVYTVVGISQPKPSKLLLMKEMWRHVNPPWVRIIKTENG